MLLDLLLPQRCLACGRSGVAVCAACLAALVRVGPPVCERCGAPTAWPVSRCVECAGRRVAFASARAAVVYDDRVRRLVAGWKEHGLRRLAAVAARLTAEAVARPDVEALTFVPPDRGRLLERGHHPAERLARGLGERWELRVDALLTRTRAGPRQRGAALADRRRNVRGVFAASRSPPRVCLVDDVYTSGATASAAAAALRKAGAREVHVVTFARAVRLR